MTPINGGLASRKSSSPPKNAYNYASVNERQGGLRLLTKKYRSPGGVVLAALALAGAVTGVGVYWYGFTNSEEINSYYGNLLERMELKNVSGPHYWKGGRIIWAGDRYLESATPFDVRSIHEVPLPDAWNGPAWFVSESILADKKNVYLKIGDQFQKVLSGFRCRYICGSQLKSGDFVIGEYGNRIYRVNAKTGEATLILAKPAEARHFHVTAVDPSTNDIYTGLGDALKKYEKFGDRVTGIMRSQDGGESWHWLYKTVVGAGAIDRQPTAVYFARDEIYFGTDSKPHGIFILDRNTGSFEQVFTMSDLFHSWFTKIEKAKASYWAISRAFSHKGFGVLWWSGDGKDWTAIQIFVGTPVWLQVNVKDDLLSVGFVERNLNVVAFKLPDTHQMSEWVARGPAFTLLDRLFRRHAAA